MSSILDALRKLEEEKANDVHAAAVHGHMESAEDELIGRRGNGGLSAPMHVTPAMLVAVGSVFAVALVAVTLFATMRVMGRPQQPVLVAQQTPPVPQQAPILVAQAPVVPQAAPSVAPVAPVTPVTEQQPVVQPAPQPPAPQPAVQPAVPQAPVVQSPPPPLEMVKVAPQPATPAPEIAAPLQKEATPLAPEKPIPVTPQPAKTTIPGASTEPTAAPKPVEASAKSAAPVLEDTPASTPLPDIDVTARANRSVTPAPEAIAPQRDDVGPVNVRALPMLSPSEISRLGLPKLTINMVAPPSESRPRPSAMINYNIVYVGDDIQGTSARLVGVDVKGIGVEISGTRYFIPSRGGQ